MSRRTAESNKAIKQAWINEKNFILEGKGTRDWSPEQQEQIITSGKAYDEKGKAIEGHHMKSVEAYPSFQGNPDNIQFLTRAEHKNAHDGNFRNSTNGKYDFVSGRTEKFKEEELIKCELLELSQPIIKQRDSHRENENIKLDNIAEKYNYDDISSKYNLNNYSKKIIRANDNMHNIEKHIKKSHSI